jgi:hypothetical protein
VTNELIQIGWASRGAPGNMERSGSPRRPETAGGAQPYSLYFYTHNATASLEANAALWRPQVDLVNTPAIGPQGVGGDPLEILDLRVERLRTPR